MQLYTEVTWHADAAEASNLVQAGRVVLAGAGHALVHIQLTARPGVALQTLALEGAPGVDALAPVLTRIGTCNSPIIRFPSLPDIGLKHTKNNIPWLY